MFEAGKDSRTIDRVTTLTAQEDTVVFYDTKEGMMGIRVNRTLELPSDQPVILTDAHGNKTKVKKTDNTGVTGNYLTSEGITGKDAWGKRARCPCRERSTVKMSASPSSIIRATRAILPAG
ncbi:MAG TPA: hypothetical protein ENK25_06360, partial [Bacteroidetes bacterium]|nr:hypothetical protein [Bacteroidota bacterium]